MESIAESLGLPFFPLTVRSAVMRNRLKFSKEDLGTKQTITESPPYNGPKHEVNIAGIILERNHIHKDSLEDDETTSTVSCSEELSSSSNSSLSSYTCPSVSFAEPLVTAVYLRPVTTPEDKDILHYSDSDYRAFRTQYIYRKKTCVVKFPEVSVVTKVYEYPKADNFESLYYSESDLQKFLDDFMSSLNECFRQSLSG